jgi:hypothetical protein
MPAEVPPPTPRAGGIERLKLRFDASLREQVRANLAAFTPQGQDLRGLRPAAVIIALVSAPDAARRELAEELGLHLTAADMLGQLDDFPTRSGFSIRPFVAWIEDDSTLSPDPAEVARCHYVPLQDLLAPGVPTLQETPWGEHPVLSISFASLDDEVFAPTAAMIYQFREVALAGRATRVAHFDQPRFAWC